MAELTEEDAEAKILLGCVLRIQSEDKDIMSDLKTDIGEEVNNIKEQIDKSDKSILKIMSNKDKSEKRMDNH